MDPIKQDAFEEIYYSQFISYEIPTSRIIVLSPSPSQFFYQKQGIINYGKSHPRQVSNKKFKHILFNRLWITHLDRILRDENIINPTRQYDKHFLCLSRADKLHRRFVNYSLHKSGVFNYGHISHQRAEDYYLDNTVNIQDEINLFNHRSDFDSALYKEFALLSHHLDGHHVSKFEEGSDNDYPGGANMVSYNYSFYELLSSKTVFEVVIESTVDDYLFLTEKIFKPIVYKKPFMIIGNPYTLKYMKCLGFKTFDCVFDESYDEEIVFYDRVNIVMDNLRSICKLPLHDCVQKLKITEEICDYNYNHFLNTDWSLDIKKCNQKLDEVMDV